MADNLTLALKIKADLEHALNNFKAFERELQRTGHASENVGKAAKVGAAGVDELGKKADQTTAKLGKRAPALNPLAPNSLG